MRYLLPTYWNVIQLYDVLALTIFGVDDDEFLKNVGENYDISSLYSFLKNNKAADTVRIPEILPVISAMWNEARKFVDDACINSSQTPTLTQPSRIRSNSVGETIMKEKDYQNIPESSRSNAIHAYKSHVELFNHIYNTYTSFKDIFTTPENLDIVVRTLFAFICDTHQMAVEDELLSREVTIANLEFDSLSSPMSPISSSAADDAATVTNAVTSSSRFIKRGGTAALTTKTSPHVSNQKVGSTVSLRLAMWNQANSDAHVFKIPENAMMDALLNFVVDICVQFITNPKSKGIEDLLTVFAAVPPSPHEEQVLFESFLMTHILQRLKATAQLDTHLLLDSHVMANLSKFLQVSADAVIHGKFREGGIEQTYDLLATILEILHTDSFTGYYGGNDASVMLLYKSFNRMVIAKLSDLEYNNFEPAKIDEFIHHCIHHQRIILSAKNTDLELLKCFCYHLYRYLFVADNKIRDAATSLLKLLVLQKPKDLENVLSIRAKGLESQDLISGFIHMLEMDHESFHRWLDSRKIELNTIFNEHISKAWDTIILQEIKYSREMFKNFVTRRINTLKKVQKRESLERSIIDSYKNDTILWSQNIYEVEIGRFAKALQDFDGHESFVQGEWSRIASDFMRERAIWGMQKASDTKWRLDYTEGPNRMRKRLQEAVNVSHTSYLSKQEAAGHSHRSNQEERSQTVTPLDDSNGRNIKLTRVAADITADEDHFTHEKNDEHLITTADGSSVAENLGKLEFDDDDDENEDMSYEEDKNRKVLRLLEQGDMVLDVYNVSQIAGLDACEGLLLLCKNNIYLIDNFFQLGNGEVVEIWDVPKEERDQYLILLAQAAGVETEPRNRSSGEFHTCRKWANADLRDVFKRRFLFRDVALEIFLNDGQNALITVALEERDELFSKIINRVSVHEESESTVFDQSIDKYTASGLGNTFKLSSIFGASSLSGLTQRWERREISNFQYLMYLNAIAGRSYNDLTQYPVFPWILADYYSSELDLDDPKTFRDLTKPMGAQTAERRQEFSERYRQWSETNDPAPAFHYGTHYSSAMIVCSFLIRLEPFTQHYLKLQGGTFDHADRLFDSISKAWESASEKNMGDVRELIPEFFYLPEFLINVNKFNFGVKQNTGETIDSVVLPPWAHNDPKIFIQKHREALESDYVSANLHHWIDLIFGYKQQGQKAVENMNVFHHVSYEGAVDLDSITNTIEKTATIGIINNFGQTPRQLFKRAHPARPPKNTRITNNNFYIENNLDNLMQSYLPHLMPPDGMRYLEWGFSDNSLRVLSTESGKVCYNVHL
ncbi:hypothetical protein BDF20DRAFT_828851 [Mycotypha africana]|uniref:uncharacterized protein n=1 Tax=Mycotypha africana TaxID=64632 RepID=UPI002301CE0A|nr:uncharacterized protein BDF20DRAFT_828851 [Mycotypha africana]KAI8967890.1 hypothetical protein BDF20DRAFT_828851 [Mycotypha africana]